VGHICGPRLRLNSKSKLTISHLPNNQGKRK